MGRTTTGIYPDRDGTWQVDKWYLQHRFRQRDWVLRSDRCRRNDVNLVCGKFARKALGAAVGHQMDRVAPGFQFMSQRFGRKQMAAGAAGGQENEGRVLVHGASNSRRRGRRHHGRCGQA